MTLLKATVVPMDGQPSFQLTDLLRYWRNTLADEDLMGLDGTSSPDLIPRIADTRLPMSILEARSRML